VGFAWAVLQFDAATTFPVFVFTHCEPLKTKGLKVTALAGVHRAPAINAAKSNAAVSVNVRRFI
jgi:hypothetical protein